MADTAQSLIIELGNTKAADASDRHKRARKIVDLIFTMEPASTRRWRAIYWLWMMKPGSYYEHLAAMHENKLIRASLLDKKFGQSAATLNKGRDLRTGRKLQHLRLLGNMPESLSMMLRRFDPLGLGMATGTHGQKMRVRLYNEFREYKIPEKL